MKQSKKDRILQSIRFVLLLGCFAFGVKMQSQPKEIEKPCLGVHYLDSTYYYVAAERLTVIPQEPKYKERYPDSGVWDLIKK